MNQKLLQIGITMEEEEKKNTVPFLLFDFFTQDFGQEGFRTSHCWTLE